MQDRRNRPNLTFGSADNLVENNQPGEPRRKEGHPEFRGVEKLERFRSGIGRRASSNFLRASSKFLKFKFSGGLRKRTSKTGTTTLKVKSNGEVLRLRG